MGSQDPGWAWPSTLRARPDLLLERDDALATLSRRPRRTPAQATATVVLVAGEAGGRQDRRSSGRSARASIRARRSWRGLRPALDTAPTGADARRRRGRGAGSRDLVRLGAPPSRCLRRAPRRAGGRPTVLVLEDLHWADEATLDVLRLLVRRIETLPVLVVGTYRDDELDRRRTPSASSSAIWRPWRRSSASTSTRSRPTRSPRLAFGHAIDPVELHRRHGRQSVLRHGGARIRRSRRFPANVRDAVLGARRATRRRGRSVLEAVALTPPGAEPWLLEAVAGRAGRPARRMPRLGPVRSTGRASRSGTSSLDSQSRRRCRRRGAAALHRQILTALADRLARRARPRPARTPCRGGARRRRRAGVRARRGGARRPAAGAYREAAAQYARALRFGGGPRARRAGGAPGGTIARVLSRRRPGRGDRRDHARRSTCRRARRAARSEGETLARARAHTLVPRPLHGGATAVEEALVLVSGAARERRARGRPQR